MKIWTKFVIVMFAAFALSSCGGSDDNKGGGSPSGNDGIVGDWVLASYAGSQEMAEKVYIRFNEGGTFALYQNINEAGYTELTGNYNYSGGSLSGTYSDGKAWKESYSVKLSGSSLTLTESNGKAAQFNATTIPDWVMTHTAFVEIPAEERFL